jgi:hypothetical protein
MTNPVQLDEDTLPRRVERSGWGSHGQKRTEWEPSAFQWAVYEQVRKGGTYRQVAAAFTEAGEPITHQGVSNICGRVDEYLAQQSMERVRAMRERHTGHLEHLFCEAMAAWEASKGIVVTEEFESVTIKGADGEAEPAEKKKRKEVHSAGNPAFLSEARAALAEIRKVHAVDKNPKIREEDEGADDERVAGKSRVQVIEETINRLLAAKQALLVTEQKSGKTTGQGQST